MELTRRGFEWDLRRCLKRLEEQGRLERFRKEVSSDGELGELLLRRKRPVLFETVDAGVFPVVAGLCVTRRDVALVSDVAEKELCDALEEGVTHAIAPVEVEAAACQEVEADCAHRWLENLPLPRFFADDAGRFLTAGLVCVDAEGDVENREPAAWSQDLGIRRLQYLGEAKFAIRVDSPSLAARIDDAAAGRRHLALAVSIGVHPLILLASQFRREWFSVDKLAIAGGCARIPVPMVKCRSSRVRVPAFSEIVLEGHIASREKADEGPVHELSGCVGPRAERSVFVVDLVTHRSGPLLPIICPGSDEQRTLSAVPRELVLRSALRRAGLAPVSVHFTLPGCARFHAVISLKKRGHGDGRVAIAKSFECFPELKMVVVVDSDVSPFSSQEVEWALATRFQAGSGLVVHEGRKASVLDPSVHQGGQALALGFDATLP